MSLNVEPKDILEAFKIIRTYLRETPFEYSPLLSERVCSRVFLKLENFQLTRSFKARGALNLMLNIRRKEGINEVITASSGNHAQGIAFASRILNMKATIVVPESCPETKKKAIKAIGGENVILLEHGDIYDEAEEEAMKIASKKGIPFVPPAEHRLIMAGAGTVGLEMMLENPDLDMILVPAGAGGLILGIATIVKALNPRIKIYGVQSEASPPWYYSWKEGKLVEVKIEESLADGLSGGIKEEMLELAKTRVDDFLLVSEEEIAEAMKYSIMELHQVVEGAGAVGLAAILSGKINVRDKRVGVVISGGNVDSKTIARILSDG